MSNPKFEHVEVVLSENFAQYLINAEDDYLTQAEISDLADYLKDLDLSVHKCESVADDSMFTFCPSSGLKDNCVTYTFRRDQE